MDDRIAVFAATSGPIQVLVPAEITMVRTAIARLGGIARTYPCNHARSGGA
jgi:hypothetical protein